MINQIKSIVLIALFLGLALALANYLASPEIKKQQEKFESQQLREIVGNRFQITPTAPLHGTKAYTLLDDEKVVGTLTQVTTYDGYNGEITFWLAVRTDSVPVEVIGVRIIHHQETPGLGDKLELGVSDWVLSFNDRQFESTRWDVRKYDGDFDQFSGATITPRAVVQAVARAIELNLEEAAKKPGETEN